MQYGALGKAFKIAGAAALAIVTAYIFQLEYAVTAGIITILTIGNTKRETLRTARNRALAFCCALFIAWFCYRFLGFQIAAFVVYLFLFACVCILAKWQEALAMDSVLISHFLVEETFNVALLGNEIALFVIGTGFGILVNLLLRRKEREFEELSNQVDEEIKQILHQMHQVLLCLEKPAEGAAGLVLLEEKIENAKQIALKNWNNTLWRHSAYELNYIRMRENQNRVLVQIDQSIRMVHFLPKQAQVVAEFIAKIEREYHRENDVSNLCGELEQLFGQMEQEELPKTREEFEARATLFYVLKQLDEFLQLKRKFIQEEQYM